jgi:hypothetical protein
LIVPDVESAPGRGRIGWIAREPEPIEALPPPEGAPEPLEAADPVEPSEPPPSGSPPPPLPVDGTGTVGALTGGVWTGPTFTGGTFTSGVDDGVGTLVPPGRSSAAGTAVMVGAAASRLTSAASVTTAASVALRKTPAIFIPEYPARNSSVTPARGVAVPRGQPGNYTF